jgi:hypothetical protein
LPLSPFPLTPVCRWILARCEALRDADGPYGAYRGGPGRRTDLYASADVALIRTIMGEDLRTTLDTERRRQWIDHINSFTRDGWAEPELRDGSYVDTLGHSRLHANRMVIGALGALGGRQRLPVRLYEPFDTPAKAVAWLERTVDWRMQWPGSHRFLGGIHCFSLGSACTDAWRDAVFTWLDANLDPATGWWRRGVPHGDRNQPLGGSVHILPIYQHHGRRFPLPERLIDSVLDLQLPAGHWNSGMDGGGDHPVGYLEMDALYVYVFARGLAPDYRADEVARSVARYGDAVVAAWDRVSGRAAAGWHPHQLLALVGILGLLNRLDPTRFPDDRRWTDIFSDPALFRVREVEALMVAAGA